MAGRPRTFDRDEVLERAMGLFWEKGYEPVGLTEILEVTGMARQSLYNTFGDKRKLYLEALRLYCNRMIGLVRGHLERPNSAYENLCDLVFSMADVSGQTSRQGDFMVNAMVEFAGNDQEVSRIVDETMGVLHGQVQATVEKAVAEGDLPASVIPRRVTLDVLNSIHGMQFLRRAGRSREEILEVAEATIEGIAYIG